MKELKVILSPHFNKEEFLEPVSGVLFEKGTGITTYSINLEDNRLTGIQSALRKNILLPFDKATNDFVNGKNIAIEEVPEEVEEVPEEVEEVPNEVSSESVEEETPVKKTRKRNKKETE